MGVISEDVMAAEAGRWRQVDPLLPVPEPSPDNCGTELMVTAEDGRPAAVGYCRHHHVEPGGAELTWRASAQFWLDRLRRRGSRGPGRGRCAG